MAQSDPHCPQCGRVIPPDSPKGICPSCLVRLAEFPLSTMSADTSARDKNLLFGVLAIQLRAITLAQFLDAAAAWASNPSRSLADRLTENGALSLTNRALVEGLVLESIRRLGGEEVQVVAEELDADVGAYARDQLRDPQLDRL